MSIEPDNPQSNPTEEQQEQEQEQPHRPGFNPFRKLPNKPFKDRPVYLKNGKRYDVKTNRPYCAARNKKTGAPCHRYSMTGCDVCYDHGGASVKGNIKHGRRMKVENRQEWDDKNLFLGSKIRAFINDPDLKSLRREVSQISAILEQRLDELKGKAEKKRMDPAHRQAVFAAKLAEAQRFKDIAEAISTGKPVLESELEWFEHECYGEQLSARDAREIAYLIDTTTKAKERMARIEEGLSLTINVPQLEHMMNIVGDIVEKVVTAEMGKVKGDEVRKRLGYEFAQAAIVV